MRVGEPGSAAPRPVVQREARPPASRPEGPPRSLRDRVESGREVSGSRVFHSVPAEAARAAPTTGYRQTRERIWNEAYAAELLEHGLRFPELPPEDRAAWQAAAQDAADRAVARFDALYREERARSEERSEIREGEPGRARLPMEDSAAIGQEALARALARYEANDHSALDPARSHVRQFTGDPNRANGNCAFASSLMALRYLGTPAPSADPDNPNVPAGNSEGYHQTMVLRSLGGAGTDDSVWGWPHQAVAALNAAGAEAAIVENTWGAHKEEAIALMRRAFLDRRTTEVFVVGGNPHNGWPDEVGHDGGHFVTVVAYDHASDRFTVLDPLARGPIQVSSEQLAGYLYDPVTTPSGAVGEGIYAGELIRVESP
jgi:hypothetical protein